VEAVSGRKPGMVRVQSRLRKYTEADRTNRGPSINYGGLAYHRARKVKQGFVGRCNAFSDMAFAVVPLIPLQLVGQS